MTAIDERALEAAARAMCAPFDPDERIYLGAYMKRWESHKDGARLAITAYLQALRPGSTGETEGWRELMKELADDLECELQARYPDEARAYPSQAMKFYADMEPVRRARAMLAAAGGAG